MRSGGSFNTERFVERPGFAVLCFRGEGAKEAFKNEGGIHTWMPAHAMASTLQVTVLAEKSEAEVKLRRSELLWQSGPGGGLARAPAAIVTHPGSGMTVCCDGGPSEQRNREMALTLLVARLYALAQGKKQAKPVLRRTVALDKGLVTDHVHKKTWPLEAYLRGEFG